MCYVVGCGNTYPVQVHHRAASIPWDGKQRDCSDGNQWLNSRRDNPIPSWEQWLQDQIRMTFFRTKDVSHGSQNQV